MTNGALSAGPTLRLDVTQLAHLRDVFLERTPDFGDFTESSGEYWRRERAYKDELSALCRATLPLALFEGDVEDRTSDILAAVRHVLTARLPTHNSPQNLASWRYYDWVRLLRPAERLRFVRAMGPLLYGGGASVERVDAFSAAVWPAMRRVIGGNPYAQARLFPSLFLMLIDPDQDIAVRTDIFKRAGSLLLGRPLLRGTLFGRAEYADVLAFAGAVRRQLEAWAWCPRDLIDVHSFLWIVTRSDYARDDETATDAGAH